MFEFFFFQKGSGRDHASCGHAGGLSCNTILLHLLTSNFTFTNIVLFQQSRKLKKYVNTKLSEMPTLPTFCILKKNSNATALYRFIHHVKPSRDFAKKLYC